MTMEEQTVEGWYDNRGKQQCLVRILGKLGEQALPGASDAEQYFRNLHRRNVSVSYPENCIHRDSRFSSLSPKLW